MVRPCRITTYNKEENVEDQETQERNSKKEKAYSQHFPTQDEHGEVNLHGLKAERWLRNWTKVDLIKNKNNNNNWRRKVN